jgi:hypothetical protein
MPHGRSNELRKRYAPSGPTSDFETIPPLPAYDTTPVIAKPAPKDEPGGDRGGHAKPETRALDLGDGIKMELVRVPGGRLNGERGRPFWIGKTEVSNEQFRKFKPARQS